MLFLMLLRIFLGRSLQELYTPALLQDQPTVLRCLGISLLLQPSNCTAVPIQISIVCAVFLQKELFFLYYFAPDLNDYRKAVDSSAKIQTNEVMLRLDGIKSLVKCSVQAAPLQPTPVRR